MKTYTLQSIERLINHYLNKGGALVEIQGGVLGYGKILLYAPGLKTCIIQERYLNEWSSTHTIRMYNKIPNKYLKYL